MILAVASLVIALAVGSSDDDIQVTAGSDDFNTNVDATDAGSQDHHVTTTTDGGGKPEVRDSDLDAICVANAITIGEDPFEFCDLPPTGDVEITPDMVAAAMARVPPPPSQIEVQPGNGRTLVNFDTNFFTGTRAFDVPLTLLGQHVDLHIVPIEFGWRFGDGESLATAEPGAPYPDLQVTHRYLKKGQVSACVDTKYTATYQVNGGPSIDVKGEVTIPGVPVDLQVLTATPTLVGYDRGWTA